MPTQITIFISYKSEQRSFAYSVRDQLHEWGYQTWLDMDNLKPRSEWTDEYDWQFEIDTALKSSSAVIGIVSPISVGSRYVTGEWDVAIVKRIPLLLLKYEECPIPSKYSKCQLTDFTRGDRTLEYTELRTHLLSYLTNNSSVTNDMHYDYLSQLYDRLSSVIGRSLIKTLTTYGPKGEVGGDPIRLLATSPAATVSSSSDPTEKINDIIDVEELFQQTEGAILLIGDPGSGKSMTLLQQARDAIIKRLQDPAQPLPMWANISTYKESCSTWLQNLTLIPQDFAEILIRGEGLLLLDGLDELYDSTQKRLPLNEADPDPHLYDDTMRISFLRQLPFNNRVLITCRTSDFRRIEKQFDIFNVVSLQPLTDAQMKAYLRDQQQVLETIGQDTRLQTLLRTPLLLSIFAFAYERMEEKDRQKFKDIKHFGEMRDFLLYQYVLQRYIHEEKISGRALGFSVENIYRILGGIAIEKAYNDSEITEEYIKLLMKDEIWFHYDFMTSVSDSPEDYSSQFINLAIQLNLLILNNSDTLDFTHRLLEQHFAFVRSVELLDPSQVFGTNLGSMMLRFGRDLRMPAAQLLGYLGDIRVLPFLLDLYKMLIDLPEEARGIHDSVEYYTQSGIRITSSLSAQIANAIDYLGSTIRKRGLSTLLLEPKTPFDDDLWWGDITIERGEYGAITKKRTIAADLLEALRSEVDTYRRSIAEFAAFVKAEESVEQGEGHQTEIDFYNRGLQQYQDGEFIAAEVSLTYAINLGKSNWEVFFFRGKALIAQKQFGDAEKDFSTALERGGDTNSEVHFLRGVTRSLQGRYTETEADFSAAIKQDPNNFLAFLFRGQTRLWLGRLQEAENDFSAALEIEPSNQDVLFHRGLVRHEQGRYVEAETDFSAVLEMQPNYWDAMFYRGLARHEQGRYVEAETDFSKVIEKDTLKREQHDDIAALVHKFEIVRESKDQENVDLDALYHHGLALYAQGKYAEADAEFSVAREHINDDLNEKDDWLVFYHRGITRLMLNNDTDAEADFSIAISNGEDFDDLYFKRGVARYGQGKYVEADADFTLALEHNPTDEVTFLYRGLVRFNLQRYEDAEIDLSSAIDQGKNDKDTYYYRGMTRQKLNNYAKAETDFTSAIEKGFNSFSVYYERGVARYEQRKYIEAEADFSTAIDRNPYNALASMFRGRARFDQKRFEDAEADFSSTIERGRDDWDVFYNRGLARLNLHNYANAENDFSHAIEKGFDSVHVFYNRCLTRYEQGKYLEAASDIALALERSENNVVFQQLQVKVHSHIDDPNH